MFWRHQPAWDVQCRRENLDSSLLLMSSIPDDPTHPSYQCLWNTKKYEPTKCARPKPKNLVSARFPVALFKTPTDANDVSE